MNARNSWARTSGAVLVLLSGLIAVNCSSSSDSNPAPAAGSGQGGGSPGGGGSAGAAEAGAPASGGTSGAGTSQGGMGVAGSNEGGAAGQAGATCDAASFAQTVGCTPCSPDPLLGCSIVVTTCIPFDNAAIPANVPTL